MAFLERISTKHGALVSGHERVCQALSDSTVACMAKILADVYVAIKTGITVTKRYERKGLCGYITDRICQGHLLP